MKLQPELHHPRSRGRAGDGSGSAGYSRGRENDQIRRIEIGAVQEVEDFRTKLKAQAFPKGDVFQDRKIPGGQARPDQRVSAKVAIESAVRRGCQKSTGVKPP